MDSTITQHRGNDPVIQFSVFADNKVGRLNDLIQRLNQHDIHIMAISQIDSTECTIVRLIVDYPETADEILTQYGYSFTETEVIAVEIDTEADIKLITSALVEAEINIFYLYSFIMRPHQKSAIAISVEDNELAESILTTRNIKIIHQNDIAR